MIQVCTLSPLLFGVFIDDIENWLESCDSEGVKLRNFVMKVLLYTDDITLLTCDVISLQKLLYTLARFCTQN